MSQLALWWKEKAIDSEIVQSTSAEARIFKKTTWICQSRGFAQRLLSRYELMAPRLPNQSAAIEITVSDWQHAGDLAAVSDFGTSHDSFLTAARPKKGSLLA